MVQQVIQVVQVFPVGIAGIDPCSLSVRIIESAVKAPEQLRHREVCLGMPDVCRRIDEPRLTTAVDHVIACPEVAVKK